MTMVHSPSAREFSVHAASARGSSLGLLVHAREVLAQAAGCADPGERFRLAHLAALRVGAALVAQRGRPAIARRRLLTVWVLLERVAPEHAEWAQYFAAGAQVRAAVEAGSRTAVTARLADDEVRAAAEFLGVVEAAVGVLAA